MICTEAICRVRNADRAFFGLPDVNGRAERRAVVPDFPLGFQFFQCREQIIFLQRVHARVVQLVQVNPVGRQPLQALLAGAFDIGGRPVMGPLFLAGLLAGRGIEIVAELGGNRHFVAMLAQRLRLKSSRPARRRKHRRCRKTSRPVQTPAAAGAGERLRR